MILWEAIRWCVVGVPRSDDRLAAVSRVKHIPVGYGTFVGVQAGVHEVGQYEVGCVALAVLAVDVDKVSQFFFE